MPFVEAFVGEGEGEREEIIAGGLAEEGDDGGAVDAAAEESAEFDVGDAL